MYAPGDDGPDMVELKLGINKFARAYDLSFNTNASGLCIQ